MIRRSLAALALGLCALLLLPGVARAEDGDDWTIDRFDITADAAEDGSIAMAIDFDFNFADEEGHGPQFVLPTRQEIEGDPEHYRAFDVTDIEASSSSGAPAQVETETDGGALVIRIGDEDVELTGVQSYRLTYTIRGVVNPAAGADGQDEIYWNVIGSQWEVPISDIRMTLTGPAEVGRTDCFAGKPGDDTGCTAHKVTAEGGAHFTQDLVEPGDGMTVVADFPPETFVGAEPRLIPRKHFGNLFPLTPLTGGVGGLLALLGVGGAVRLSRRGRDQAYAGLTPGLSPVAGKGATTVGNRDPKQAIAVRFTPPDGVLPGQMGTVLDERADLEDVTATIIDLAVRGHLRIEEYTEPERDDVVSDPVPDWKLIKVAELSEEARPYEQEIFDGLFGKEDEVILSEVPDFTETASSTKDALYDEVTELGWFQKNPQHVRTRWYLAGFLVFFLGVAATIGLSYLWGWGWIGAGLTVAGIALVAVVHKLPVRTAEGSVVLAQTLGFKQYLETAEADQIKFEEGEDLFSRYLPHAIVFGVADRWAGIFAELATYGRNVPDPTWYTSAAGVGIWQSSLSDFGTSFTGAAVSGMSGATSGSGGGSGFGGGMVGGGVGGGGGGGW